VVWDTTVGDRSKGEYANTSGLIAVRGKLTTGIGRDSCATYREEKCFISAYDEKTGKEARRFRTVALEGEPGDELRTPVSGYYGMRNWHPATYRGCARTTRCATSIFAGRIQYSR
jgi:hypothetical protein